MSRMKLEEGREICATDDDKISSLFQGMAGNLNCETKKVSGPNDDNRILDTICPSIQQCDNCKLETFKHA
jgi:hypothetical protein